jgi:transcriptional antiterminator RfaH
MPLLAKETYTWPPTLLECGECDDLRDGESRSWWALYTFSRREKVLMRKLLADERRFCCPMVMKTHRVGRGAPRRAYVPLFSNYVFLCGDDDDRYRAVCTGEVARYLPIPDPTRFERQLRDIQQVLDSGESVTVTSRMAVGALVRVKTGPFRGMLGRVTHVRKRTQFTVFLDFMQQGVSLAADDWELEAVD